MGRPGFAPPFLPMLTAAPPILNLPGRNVANELGQGDRGAWAGGRAWLSWSSLDRGSLRGNFDLKLSKVLINSVRLGQQVCLPHIKLAISERDGGRGPY
jgi:hypothetical protein